MKKSIKVTDKGTIIDLMTGTDGYTISSGICPSYLRGDDIISIPLEVEEIIRIGVITHKDYRPTALGQMYLDILHRVVGDMQGNKKSEKKAKETVKPTNLTFLK